MKRELERFGREVFDVAIIGGGIYGASLAWEAASRGLTAALLEKDDFNAATSANSMKVIHGGFRYLQQADVKRIRESVRERRALLRIAPHLVHPLPVLVPAYGHGMKGREALTAALLAYDLLSRDRNQLDDRQKHIPNGRMLSVRECLERAPGIEPQGLTGGALFYDALAHNSERLGLAFLEAAYRAGAALTNYTEVTRFLVESGRVTGVQVRDYLSGGSFDVRARLVINAAGPWVGEVLGLAPGLLPAQSPGRGLVKAVNLVTRRIFEGQAVGLRGDNGYEDGSGVRRSESVLFIVPWRGRSMVGTIYQPHRGPADDLSLNEFDIHTVMRAINAAYPPAELTRQDITFAHVGLLPVDPRKGPGAVAQHFTIEDHARAGYAGLLTVTGVKYTTARDVAQKTVDRAFALLGKLPEPSVSAFTRLPGGDIEQFEPFLEEAIRSAPCALGPESLGSLVYTYGSVYPQALRLFPRLEVQASPEEREAAMWVAQARYAVREEMAYKLADVIFRRTELGAAGYPGETVLAVCAAAMAGEFGWSADRTAAEIAEVEQRYVLFQDQQAGGDRSLA